MRNSFYNKSQVNYLRRNLTALNSYPEQLFINIIIYSYSNLDTFPIGFIGEKMQYEVSESDFREEIYIG